MTRAYRLGRREDAAAATRRRILDVATELMTASGFHPVAIDDIAAQAGTSRPTVYRHFGSKVGLFEAVAWNVLSTAGIARVDEARELDDPLVALREFLRANCRMFAEMGTRLSAARRRGTPRTRHRPDPGSHVLRPPDRFTPTAHGTTRRRRPHQARMDTRSSRRRLSRAHQRGVLRITEPASRAAGNKSPTDSST